ncbi:putative carnosine N-methyltransferase [Microsporum audouinii]
MSSREAQAAGGLEGRPHPQQEEVEEEDVEEQEWSGAFDPFADPEERRVLFASLDSFRQYRRSAHRNVTHRRRQSFYALPSLHWQTLAAPPFKLLETFDKVDAAIDSNAEVAEAILDSALEAFQLPKHPQTQEAEGRGDVNWHDRATSSDVSKANSTIRQLYRDWSAGGAGERESCYGPVMRDLQAEFGEKPAPGTRVLIPGAGLGRLVFDTAMAGFDAEGNEISYHQLVTSSWVLNRTRRKEECAIYPFVLHFSNLRTREQQFKKVLVPDVHPGSAVRGYEEAEETAGGTGGRKETKKMTGTMSMTAADFLLLYNEESNREAFHAVATVFFIDTAPNLIRYIQTVHHCLRPGGIWTNVGPLLWHFEDKPAPSSSRTQSTSGKVVEDAAASAHAPGDDDLEKEYQGHSHSYHGHSHGHGHSHSHGRGHGGQGEGIGDPGVVELSQDEVLTLIERIGFTIEKVEDDIGGCGYIQDPDSMLFNMYKPVHWIARKR